MQEVKTLGVAIVGGGPGCKAVMDIIFSENLVQLRMQLIGVACTNPTAVGYRYAQEKGIYTTDNYCDLYKLKDLDMIIELTGREEVANEICRTKPEYVRVMDHVAAHLFWDVFDIEEQRITERKHAEYECRKSQRKCESLSMQLQLGLSDVFEALREISSGNPEVRIPETSELDLIVRLKQMINLTARDLSEIVGLSHEFAIGLAEHFDVLNRVSKGDLDARVSGDTHVELLERLKNVTNQMIHSVSTEIVERKRTEEELEKSREQLRSLATHLQFIREEERRLISCAIHDELGQVLTALKMDLHWLAKRLPTGEDSVLDKIKSMSKLTDITVESVQKICAQLRPGLLDDLGLSAAIEWQAEEWQNRTGITCEATLDPEEVALNQDLSAAIFRIFQETLTNIARHADASRVTVSLKRKAGELELKVTDNGKGITQKQISDPKSFGLIGMRERARYWGGDVNIRGNRNKGSTVIARIPRDKKVKPDDQNNGC